MKCLRFLACALLFVLHGTGLAQELQLNPCGALENHYGPFDYRTQKAQLRIVEKFHFTPPVEALIRGESSSFVGNDLSYTLATSPNHLRALAALVKLGELTKSAKPPYMTYSIDCYFDRAVRFQPEDVLVRILFGRYLGRTGRADQAIVQLEEADRLAGDNPLTHYNIGLMYFELSMFDRALQQAHRARKLGFTGTELDDKLRQAGKWRDPEPEERP